MKLTEELTQLKSLVPTEEANRRISELRKKLPWVIRSSRWQNGLLEQININTERGIPSFLYGFSDENGGETIYFLFEEQPSAEFLERYLLIPRMRYALHIREKTVCNPLHTRRT
jgi:hypothetical protein